ncbi:MAG: hypothetical protein AAF526_14635, partial [Pseudomonadota bacterium]
MIYAEHVRPGDLVSPLALDAARGLYARLGLDRAEIRADVAHQTLKQALEWGQFPRFHEKRWTCLKGYAEATLEQLARDALLNWFMHAYTGYHPANPDLSIWLDMLSELHHTPENTFEMPLTPAERKPLEAFLERVAAAQDAEAFNEELDELRGLPPSPWDRKILAHYEMVYHDRAAGSDPFIILKAVNRGEGLRRVLSETPPAEIAGFPLEKLD